MLALVLAVACATALASCGSDSNAKLLPGATASEITANLEEVRQLAGEGECIGAENAANAVSEQVEELNGVDQKLKQALSEGAARLNEVVTGCEESSEDEAEELRETEEEEFQAQEKATEKAEQAEEKATEKTEKAEEKEQPKEAKEPPAETTEPPEKEAGGEIQPVEPGGETGSGGVGPGIPAGEG